MASKIIQYETATCKMYGTLFWDDSSQAKRGAVIVAHAWLGKDEFAVKKAEELSEMGYVAFAADLYGEGKQAKDEDEAKALMLPLFIERKILQERIVAALDCLKQQEFVDEKKIGAIGFCFGGLTVIELLRTGMDIAGVVSFHGVLGDSFSGKSAIAGVRNKKIKGSLLLLTGYDDPLVTEEDLIHLEKEMTENGADWQITIYGNTAHAFMVNQMNKPKSGLVYNAKTAKRAWQAMINFFEEVL